MNRFDWHNWEAKVYITPEEIDEALQSFGVKGKKIKEVHTIGLAHNMEKWSYTQTMRQTLAEAGVSYQDIDSGKYPVDTALVPCEVEICEPVVFILEDDTTFEIMPWKARGLKMAVNQIPADVIDGINFSNYNANILFSGIIGSAIDHFQTIERNTTSYGTYSDHPEKRRNITFQLWLKSGKENYGCFFRQAYEGWFNFGLTLQNHFMELGNKTATVRFSKVKKSARNKKQVVIVEGHDTSSYFWIMPVKIGAKTEDNWDGVDEYRPEEISIEEDDVGEFLYYFLAKYFDSEFPYGDARDEYCSNHFEWNLEYNIYTYDTMKKMLDEIERFSNLFLTDFFNPELDEIKKKFSVYAFDENALSKGRPSDAEKEEIIHKNITIATDFYERFVCRMRSMMEHAPDFELISFMGP